MTRGFLGGTFDPPHFGHLVLAQEALEFMKLDHMCFVPARNPPHKGEGAISDFSHRKKMLSLSISGDPRFSILDVEPVNGPSYTVNLVRRLNGLFGAKPCLVMGLDSLLEMESWKDPLTILEEACVIVGTRPGFSTAGIVPVYLESVRMFSFPGIWLSSSMIRARVSEGKSIRYLVSDGVRSYIREKGFYGSGKGD
ncbi:MAG: nicotinate (nicotinamide) nucleotide adenylyltransferase [Candidatus Fermentibacteraceae bacterium]